MKQQPTEVSKQTPSHDCGCGCDGNCSKPVRLNESKQYITPISEGLRYHINNKLTLNETIYRPGSEAHIKLIYEARTLWKQGVINIYGEDKELFETTDLGRIGVYEGEIVPLDLPLMEIENIPGGLAKGMSLEDIAKHHKINIEYIKGTLAKGIKIEMEHTTDKNIAKEIAMDHIYEDPKYYDKLKKIEENSKEKKQPALGKPKRGGSKKFYVYVKDPKTKRIKKVSFGDTTGLSAKINNPEARKAFAARHDCANKKDRTKASYWSCRLPRYAKLLGLKSSFSGFW